MSSDKAGLPAVGSVVDELGNEETTCFRLDVEALACNVLIHVVAALHRISSILKH